MRDYMYDSTPEIYVGCEVKIKHQDIVFTVTDIFYDDYTNEYCSLVYCKDASGDRPLSVIELKKVSVKACEIWLF